MEYNNDPKLVQQNLLLVAQLEAKNEVISELRRMVDFMSQIVKNLSVAYGK